jgi:hypothetical protein
MIRQGYLADHTHSQPAVDALNELLSHPDISPLNQFANSIVSGVSHIFSTLRRIRRSGEEDEVVKNTRSLMARNWDKFAEYFAGLTAEYEEIYRRMREEAVVGSQ